MPDQHVVPAGALKRVRTAGAPQTPPDRCGRRDEVDDNRTRVDHQVDVLDESARNQLRRTRAELPGPNP